jgi:Glycosyltransferase family 87
MQRDLGQPVNSSIIPWQRLAIAVWMTVLLAICIRGLLNARTNSVYPIFARAARDFLAGADLYRVSDAPYRYSPLVAALLVPFSVWPDHIGGVLWRLLNAALYLTAFAWWCRMVLPRPLTISQQAILYLLIVPLSVGSLNNAQSNPVVLGLLMAGVAAVARGRWNWASVCLALACLFKVYPLAVGLLLAVVHPRQFAGRFLIALLIGLAVPFLLKPSAYVLEQYGNWLHHLQTDDRQHLPADLWYRDLRLLCLNCHVSLSPAAYRIVQLLAAAGIALFCIAGRLASWEHRRLLTVLFGLGCCWMTLFGSATESCTYMLLAPALAWSLLDAWLRQVPYWLRCGLGASFVLFLVTQTAVWFPGGGRQIHALGLQPLAALLLLVCIVVMEVQNREAERNANGAVLAAQAA